MQTILANCSGISELFVSQNPVNEFGSLRPFCVSYLSNLQYFNSVEITREERFHSNKVFSFLLSVNSEEQLKKQFDHSNKDSDALHGNLNQKWKDSFRNNRTKTIDPHNASIISDTIDNAVIGSLHNFDLASKFDAVSFFNIDLK